jgi:hypothetical protein
MNPGVGSNDARTKEFSRQTSIQVFVGVKVYKNTFRAIWGKRRAMGHGMHIQAVDRGHSAPILCLSGVSFIFCYSLSSIFGGFYLISGLVLSAILVYDRFAEYYYCEVISGLVCDLF